MAKQTKSFRLDGITVQPDAATNWYVVRSQPDEFAEIAYYAGNWDIAQAEARQIAALYPQDYINIIHRDTGRSAEEITPRVTRPTASIANPLERALAGGR